MPDAGGGAIHIVEVWKDLVADRLESMSQNTPVSLAQGRFLFVPFQTLELSSKRIVQFAKERVIILYFSARVTCAIASMAVSGRPVCRKIPAPPQESQRLLQAPAIRLPEALPCRNVPAVTPKQLSNQQKSS